LTRRFADTKFAAHVLRDGGQLRIHPQRKLQDLGSVLGRLPLCGGHFPPTAAGELSQRSGRAALKSANKRCTGTSGIVTNERQKGWPIKLKLAAAS
jgi:hypothetical protein